MIVLSVRTFIGVSGMGDTGFVYCVCLFGDASVYITRLLYKE